MLPMIYYQSLIDPICIPMIRYLREGIGIDTKYCCQGTCKEDPRPYKLLVEDTSERS